MPLDLFGLEWEAGGDPIGVPGAGADRHVLRDIRARLAATNAFDVTARGNALDVRGRPADRSAVAILRALDWQESPVWDDDEATGTERVVKFILDIVVRDQRDEIREDKLDVLFNVAANAINHKSLAGITVPVKTYLRQGKYLDPKPPEQTLRITGEFAYLVDSPSSHDDDDSDE